MATFGAPFCVEKTAISIEIRSKDEIHHSQSVIFIMQSTVFITGFGLNVAFLKSRPFDSGHSSWYDDWSPWNQVPVFIQKNEDSSIGNGDSSMILQLEMKALLLKTGRRGVSSTNPCGRGTANGATGASFQRRRFLRSARRTRQRDRAQSLVSIC